MINFKQEPYRWQKKMNIIMENVNLEKIEFCNDNSILFSFLNSCDGKHYNDLLCSSVWKFSEENNFEKGDELPYFIYDVRMKKLEKYEIKAAFDYLKYGWDVPESNEYYLICLDSGVVSINLICGNVSIK